MDNARVVLALIERIVVSAGCDVVDRGEVHSKKVTRAVGETRNEKPSNVAVSDSRHIFLVARPRYGLVVRSTVFEKLTMTFKHMASYQPEKTHVYDCGNILGNSKQVVRHRTP